MNESLPSIEAIGFMKGHSVKYTSSKELNAFIHQLVGKDWTYSSGSKHGKIRPPAGYPVLTVPTSPSDRRAFLNFRRDVRHCSCKLTT